MRLEKTISSPEISDFCVKSVFLLNKIILSRTAQCFNCFIAQRIFCNIHGKTRQKRFELSAEYDILNISNPQEGQGK